MTKLIASLPGGSHSAQGLFGLIAAREGFARGRGWLRATIAAIEHNVTVLEEQLAASLPAVRLRRPGRQLPGVARHVRARLGR